MIDTHLTLRPLKRKWLLSFLVSIVLFIISLNYLRNISDYSGTNDNKGVVFFLTLIIGSVAVYTCFRLLPISSYLQLNSKGFKWQSLFYGDMYLWEDVSNFTANRFGYVIFDVNVHGRQKSLLESHISNSMKNIKGIFGNKGALPDNYGKTSAELVSILNSWKKRYSKTSNV